MNIQNTFDLIPTDLLHEIFSRLPAKSVGRCRCVSKKLASILGREDFKQLFLTRSLTRPRLLFVFEQQWSWWVFYSSPQPQNEKLSLVLTAECPRLKAFDFIYASGLFYFSEMFISTTKAEKFILHVICNPSTGQYVVLPKLRSAISPKSFLGFDPIDKQFKLLVMNAEVDNERINYILTLGTGKMRWRTIKCPLLSDYSYIYRKGICINGVLYYLVEDIDNGVTYYMIVCFDVRTETFKSKFNVGTIQGYNVPQLINCKGKLGITILRERYDSVELDIHFAEAEEDVEEQEWAKYTLPKIYNNHYSVVGMTSTGEIILSTVFKPFYLYYFNLEKKSYQSVEIQGSENHNCIRVIMDHVEDLYVNDAEYFKSDNITSPKNKIINFLLKCFNFFCLEGCYMFD